MTLTFDLSTGNFSQRDEYLGQRSCTSVITRTYRHTHRTDCSTWTTKVVSENHESSDELNFIITIIKTTRLSVTEAVSVRGWPMHGKQT